MYEQIQLPRRSLLRGGALMIGLAGTGVLLAACGGSPEPAEPAASSTPTGDASFEPVSQKHMTPSAFSSSFIEVMVAKELGYFKEFGIDMELQQAGASPLPALASLSQGDIDYGRETGTGGILGIVGKGLPLRGIATIRQRSQWELVSLPDSGITSAEDIANKTVGIVAAGGITESFVIMTAQNAGVDPETVTRPVVGLGQAGWELAKKGEIDAWISLDSHRAAIERGGTQLWSSPIDEFVTVPSDTYLVTKKTIDSGSDAPARFLAAIRLAVDFTKKSENFEEVASILQRYNKDVKTESVIADLPLLIDQWMAKGESNLLELHPEDWEEGQQQLKRAGQIDRVVPTSELIYDGYLARAKELAGV